MNLTHPATQRLMALAHVLEARAEVLVAPTAASNATRLLEAVALEYTGVAADLRRTAETIGEPAAPPASLGIVLDHAESLTHEHARLLEMLDDCTTVLGGSVLDSMRLRDAYGIAPGPEAFPALQLAVLNEARALIEEVTAAHTQPDEVPA